jgi:hypothetical protein
MHELLAKCRIKSQVPWEDLMSQFSRKLVALSERLTDDELYSLMDIVMACYQKGYDEFATREETENLLKDIRRRTRHTVQ